MGGTTAEKFIGQMIDKVADSSNEKGPRVTVGIRKIKRLMKVTYVRKGLTITISTWKPWWSLGGKRILRYACVSVATGRNSLSGKIKGDDLEEKGNSGRPYWGFCVRQQHHFKTFSVDKNP